MRYKILGRTGLRVSELCLGTMTFGEDWSFGASKEVSRKIFDAFCNAGGNFIDTANTYTYGTSEKLIGEFIAQDRKHFVISTKYSLSTNPEDANGGGNSRKQMFQAIEGSLDRLKSEYVDVFWLHVWDTVTPIDEIMRGLEDLARSGKTLYIGISNAPAWLTSYANMFAEGQGWSKFVGIQIEYSLIQRTAERELLPMSRALNLGVLAWAPLGGGILSGKYVLKGDEIHIGESKRGNWLNSDRLTRKTMQIASAIVEVSQELKCPPSQVALNWIRQRPGDIIPIVAGRTLEQMAENLACLGSRLGSDHIQQLDSVSEISLGYPHEFLASEALQTALLGAKRHCF
jgi:aryl-alcohol dehydrogenase-like predicted oxidoreductase